MKIVWEKKIDFILALGGGSVIDVLIDTSGACTAALIFLGITLIVKLRKKRTKT